MAGQHPLLLHEGAEALDGSVEGVEAELCEAGHLAGQVPAVLQTQQHRAALDVHQVSHRTSHLHSK